MCQIKLFLLLLLLLLRYCTHVCLCGIKLFSNGGATYIISEVTDKDNLMIAKYNANL